MKKHNLYALVAAGLLASGMTVSSASAADLGGNCCADLEERIAELEATTARKGNRKVSLTVSGWVGQQVTFWDDGAESNTYVHDLGTTLGSHVKFTGSAQISPGWSAGYVLQIEAIGAEGLGTTNQNNPNGPALLTGTPNSVQTLQSYWFVKSDQLGKLGVGKQSQASDNTAILVDGSGSLVPANFVAFDYGGFFLRRTDGVLANGGGGVGAGATYLGALGCTDCNGVPQNSVRYDSPTFGGFSVSASWGADDFWDVAARYAGEFSGFKLAAAAAYSESTDNGAGRTFVQAEDTQFFQAGLFLMHVPTGLFGYGAYTDLEGDGGGVNAGNDSVSWYVKGGLRTRLSALGHTVFYGEYQDFSNDAIVNISNLAGAANAQNVAGTDGELWGAGIVQEIDAAAMSVWVKYRNVSMDVGAQVGAGPVLPAGVGIEDFQYVGVGGLINF
jgi:hypothetical protein